MSMSTRGRSSAASDVYKREDAGRALASFEQSLEIAERLYAQNPADAQAARDVSMSHERLGNLYLRRGQDGAGRALASFEQSLVIAERLYAQNTADAQPARGVVVSHRRMGDL